MYYFNNWISQFHKFNNVININLQFEGVQIQLLTQPEQPTSSKLHEWLRNLFSIKAVKFFITQKYVTNVRTNWTTFTTEYLQINVINTKPSFWVWIQLLKWTKTSLITQSYLTTFAELPVPTCNHSSLAHHKNRVSARDSHPFTLINMNGNT